MTLVSSDEESSEDIISELENILNRCNEEGEVISIPMTPDYFPPLLYKRIKGGHWFYQGLNDNWYYQTDSNKMEHIFQAGRNNQ